MSQSQCRQPVPATTPLHLGTGRFYPFGPFLEWAGHWSHQVLQPAFMWAGAASAPGASAPRSPVVAKSTHTAGSLPSYQPSAPRDGPGDPAAQPPPLPPLMAPRPCPPHPGPWKSTTTPAGRLAGPPGSPHHPSLRRPHILCICGAEATCGRPALPRLPPAPASCFQAPRTLGP